MWLQEGSNKPFWVEVRNKDKANEVARKGYFVSNGRKVRVVGFGGSEELRSVLRVFWSEKSETWTEYAKLKSKVKRFKQTGEWS